MRLKYMLVAAILKALFVPPRPIVPVKKMRSPTPDCSRLTALRLNGSWSWPESLPIG